MYTNCHQLLTIASASGAPPVLPDPAAELTMFPVLLAFNPNHVLRSLYTLRPTISDRIVQMEVGVEMFSRWGLREEVGVEQIFRHGVEKEVGLEFCHKL